MSDIQNIEFLRNDYESSDEDAGIILAGISYPTVEHAYQAAKTSDRNIREKIGEASVKKAKMIGRSAPLIDGWKSKRLVIMETLVRQKFFADDVLQDQLIETGDAPLLMVRDDDAFWGCSADGDGKNHLGKILEKVRAEAQLIRGWNDPAATAMSDDPDIQLVLDQVGKIVGLFEGMDIEDEDLFAMLCMSNHAPPHGNANLDKYKLTQFLLALELAWTNLITSAEDDQE